MWLPQVISNTPTLLTKPLSAKFINWLPVTFDKGTIEQHERYCSKKKILELTSAGYMYSEVELLDHVVCMYVVYVYIYLSTYLDGTCRGEECVQA